MNLFLLAHGSISLFSQVENMGRVNYGLFMGENKVSTPLAFLSFKSEPPSAKIKIARPLRESYGAVKNSNASKLPFSRDTIEHSSFFL